MIDRAEIETMSSELQVNTSNVQRDYVHGWLLSRLYSSSSLANRLVLKGGNCFRKGYFEAARYSNDLDFSSETAISNEEILTELRTLCTALETDVGIRFMVDKTIVRDKRRVDPDKTISEARLYFRDFYGDTSEIIIGIRLDVTQFDRRYLPVQHRNLIHPYSDAGECSKTILCVKLEELLATKMRCLLQRKHVADLFDLIYALFFDKSLQIDRSEVLSTFFRITIFRNSPAVVKGLLIDLPLEGLRRFWTDYIACPAKSLFDFDTAKSSFVSLIDQLLPGAPVRGRHSMYFASSLRNAILAAADNTTLLKVVYDGVPRLVEPYEIAFKSLKDGTAKEYFYAYDTTGGRTSPPGIKAFLPDKMTSVDNTNEVFVPRYEVQIRKSGSAELARPFTRRSGNWNPVDSPRPRRHAPPIPMSQWNSYTVRCLYCGKTYRRNSFSTTLNPHKDKYGNPCPGRIGVIV